MDLTQRVLEQFVVLAEERHFGRAAERLSMSQPPLSQAVQRLERRLGVTLLERSTRTVRLTPAGDAFAHDARHLLEAQNAAVERARRIAHGTEGELHLGFISGLAYTFLPGVLRLSRAHLPDLRIHLHQHSSAELVSRVRSGTIDLAFVRGPLADTDALTLRAIEGERLCVALPATHPLADREQLRLADLAHEDVALPSLTALAGLAEQVVTACRAEGFAPRDAARADSLSGLLSHVAAGHCVCLVPEQVRSGALPGVTFRSLADTDTSGHLTLSVLAATRAGHDDPAVRRILGLLAVRNPEG
ncbi:LysR family transcriptional regulator [Streptomyces sp. NA02950]|uniref:LysR family transcriptional regulator n=1 Tax=Streptomyces sp. NA02950 TaxID=2742137 RepID=UPI001590A2F0|nr:LysR family transcriptional regulator [Streptomyces sp. NA02950]QKV96213.1 LysR family transcriptional regulator [Streptomyces sp. NA02950]